MSSTRHQLDDIWLHGPQPSLHHALAERIKQ